MRIIELVSEKLRKHSFLKKILILGLSIIWLAVLVLAIEPFLREIKIQREAKTPTSTNLDTNLQSEYLGQIEQKFTFEPVILDKDKGREKMVFKSVNYNATGYPRFTEGGSYVKEASSKIPIAELTTEQNKVASGSTGISVLDEANLAVFTPDNKYAIYTNFYDGLFVISLLTGVFQKLNDVSDISIVNLEISPDGTKIAYSSGLNESPGSVCPTTIWFMDLNTREKKNIWDQETEKLCQLIAMGFEGGYVQNYPIRLVWSSDSQKIYFLQDRNILGEFEIASGKTNKIPIENEVLVGFTK